MLRAYDAGIFRPNAAMYPQVNYVPGFTGLGWIGEHLVRKMLTNRERDEVQRVNDTLFIALRQKERHAFGQSEIGFIPSRLVIAAGLRFLNGPATVELCPF